MVIYVRATAYSLDVVDDDPEIARVDDDGVNRRDHASAHVIEYPQKVCVQGHVTSLECDNISKTVQDRHSCNGIGSAIVVNDVRI